MEHWKQGYVNRILERGVFLAVRWAQLVELLLARRARHCMAEQRFLVDIERAWCSSDEEGHGSNEGQIYDV